jgi:hypothetical protein
MKVTVFLARFLGLFLIIESLSMLTQKPAMLELITRLIQDRPLLFIVEVLGVLGGLAMVLGHTVWSGGLLPVVVTLIGWVALIRSVVLLFISPEAVQNFVTAIRFEQNYYLFVGISLLLGLYLTYAGFKTRPATVSDSNLSTSPR